MYISTSISYCSACDKESSTEAEETEEGTPNPMQTTSTLALKHEPSNLR